METNDIKPIDVFMGFWNGIGALGIMLLLVFGVPYLMALSIHYSTMIWQQGSLIGLALVIVYIIGVIFVTYRQKH